MTWVVSHPFTQMRAWYSLMLMLIESRGETSDKKAK